MVFVAGSSRAKREERCREENLRGEEKGSPFHVGDEHKSSVGKEPRGHATVIW